MPQSKGIRWLNEPDTQIKHITKKEYYKPITLMNIDE